MDNSVHTYTSLTGHEALDMFKPMNQGVLSAVGNTPLVSLKKIFRDADFKLYGKLEALNPGGSAKDRAATSILKHGIESGAIKQNTIVVESSSGNMGIGLAQAC